MTITRQDTREEDRYYQTMGGRLVEAKRPVPPCAECVACGICMAHDKNGEEECTMFHRRLAGMVNGVAELAQVHPKNENPRFPM